MGKRTTRLGRKELFCIMSKILLTYYFFYSDHHSSDGLFRPLLLKAEDSVLEEWQE